MNLDNQTPRCIQTTKAELKKQLEQTHDETHPTETRTPNTLLNNGRKQDTKRKIPIRRPYTMNESKFKKYCLEYIRYSAILEHLKSSDASWGQMQEVTRIMEQICEDMKKELG